MKEIIALQQYTDKFISLYQGEVRNIQDSLADKLIEKGIVAEHDQISPSGGGNGLKYVKDDSSNNGGVIEGLVEGNIGQINVASGQYAHAEGSRTTASEFGSHAEGAGTTASEFGSHAEGAGTTASRPGSHAEGSSTTASGDQSHAEGVGTTASGSQSHAEGAGTIASGPGSHAEGSSTTASGDQSHAEGAGTTASGPGSHAEGAGTTANHKSQHVIGEYNIADPSIAAGSQRGNYVFIIGNGTSTDACSNALAMKWNGTLVLSDGTEVTQAQIKALLALLT